jgi:hypothetical protein
MSGEGAGDRPGALPSGISGGRHASPLRCISVGLVDLKGRRIAQIAIVADADLPKVVMFEGEPFLRMPGPAGDRETLYLQVRAYRADAMVIELAT